ncbi:DUF6708 domain-containing protein [Pseudomonas shirazensis]|uniref:DUF6708 domain-containing protein n=1 Tax=Pseudomonas shirazensis TaxID=2745494 RepID=UPI003D2C4721
MYLIEWMMWRSILESAETRKKYKHINTKRIPDIYESDEAEALVAARKVVSNTPKSRGPVYIFNDQTLEIRCGMWESKRGLITTISAPLIAVLILGGVGAADFLITAIDILYEQNKWSFTHWYVSAFLTILVSSVSWFYAKYGFTFTCFELFTSRHLLIRFNRKTQQVYLHRPVNCGGIVTLPWAGINASATDKIHSTDDSIGMPLALYWLPRWTGTLHIETAWVGKVANNHAELRHEWEFIRRFMEVGPEGLPRPRITSHFPWPWQAFTPQFEGLTHYFRRSSWIIKLGLVLISPAFLILGLGHWLSLLLCWKPRWPKIIREAGLPGKPIPPLTTLADRPPHIQERLRENAHLWAVRPGQRPAKKPRSTRRSPKDDSRLSPSGTSIRDETSASAQNPSSDQVTEHYDRER